MPTDLSNIKTTKGREYREEDIKEINDSLYYLPDKQRASILASIIEESGGDPLAKSKSSTYQGLLQWGPDRYRIKSGDRRKELKNQLQYLKNTIYNTTDKKSWTHGGTGSGYDSFAEPFTKFHSTDLPLDSVYRGFSYGYVRPEGKEDAYQNRLKVAKQVLDRYPKIPDYLSTPETFSKIAFENMGVSTTKAEGGPIETPKRKMWHELSQAEKAEMMKVAIRNGITNLQEIRKKYNEFAEGGNIYDGTTMPTQQMQTDATYVNTPIAPIYSPVYQLPEVTVRPDSNLSPAERVLAERARKQAHDRAFGKGSYDAYRRQEQIDYLRDKAARPTNVDRALDYAASLVSGIGQGADIASMTMGGLPVYSALKGAKALSEKDYVDGAMWMTPMLGAAGKKAYDAAKPAVKKFATAMRNYLDPLGETHVPEKYLTIKPQHAIGVDDAEIGSYNHKLNEKDVRNALFEAEEYKASDGYADLIERTRRESKKLGFGDFPSNLFSYRTRHTPTIILEKRPDGRIGGYRQSTNTVSIDPDQIKPGEEVPFHEGIHWQRVGSPEGPLYDDWLNSYFRGSPEDVVNTKYSTFYNSAEAIGRDNASNYLKYKINNALYEEAGPYLREPGELQTLGVETGKALGIKPFTEYPGYIKAKEAISKARDYSKFWWKVKAGTDEEVQTAWELLTGNFAPATLPVGIAVGTALNKNKEDY